jgi:hypothetical protein
MQALPFKTMSTSGSLPPSPESGHLSVASTAWKNPTIELDLL